MMQYGGIYLDNDVFVIRSLDKYRKYEIAMNWDENQFLARPVIIANKDARFLPICGSTRTTDITQKNGQIPRPLLFSHFHHVCWF